MLQSRKYVMRNGCFLVPAIMLALVPSEFALAEGFDPFAGGDAGPRVAGPSSQPASTMPADRAFGSSLRQTGPTIGQVQFNDEDINMVFQIISDASGWCIFPSPKVRGKVSLYAKNISAGSLLEEAVRMAGFVHIKQGNTISVMSYEEYIQYYGVVKQVMRLQQRDAEEVARLVIPFLTPRGKLAPDPMTRSLVIYEVPNNLPMLEGVIREIDVSPDQSVIEVVKLVFADASALGEELQQIYEGQRKDDGQPKVIAAASQPAADVVLSSGGRSVTILPVSRTNHLVLKGYRQDILQIKTLIQSLDVAPEFMTTRTYPVKHLAASDLVDSLQQALGLAHQQAQGSGPSRSRSQIGGRQQSSRSIDNPGGASRISVNALDENNTLVVTAPSVVHRQVVTFLEICDVPPLEVAGGIQVYKLENSDATEVAQILQQLIDQGSQQNERGKMALNTGQQGQVRNIGPSQVGATAAGQGSSSPVARPASEAGDAAGSGDGAATGERWVEKPRVAAQASTNSVIIQASAQQQAQFAQLIKQMDRRRNQVLLEVVVVDMTGTDDVDVGFEFEQADKAHDNYWGHLIFTSYGLSTLDPVTNQRTVTVLPGGSAAVIRTDYVPVILHALRNSGKGKIRTAPRILVNDNAKGEIQSITERPYKQVNASSTVATTSFGGYVQAGTELAVIPHVSESDYLVLDYQITLNSFLDQAAGDELPPGRDTNLITSQATVPDGDTLIVGGLNYRNKREQYSRLPLLGDIPLAGRLFGRTTTSQDDIRLYVFITPKILRDSQFRDLRSISEQQRAESKEPSAYPTNPSLELYWGDPQ